MARATLSEIASRLAVIDRTLAFHHEEVDLVGAPSECHGLVSRSMEKLRREAFEELGWTPREFDRELRRRLSVGAIYRLGFLPYLDVDPEDVARSLMAKVRGFYEDPEAAGSGVKVEMENWACCMVVSVEVIGAMMEVRHLYDTPREAAEDMKYEVDRWVSQYIEKCDRYLGGCGRLLAYCACP